MENKRITAEELSVLVWLKLLDDFELTTEEGEVVENLSEKIDRFDMMTADIEPQFFYDTVNKLEELELVTELSLSDLGTKVASALLVMENAKNKVTASFKEIVKFIKDNKEEIISVLEVIGAVVALI